MTTPVGPVTPQARGPVGRLVGAIVFATVWNGFVGAIAWPWLTNWNAGNLFPLAILGVFAIPGVLIAISLPYRVLALFSPRLHLTLSAAGAPPGGAIQVSWRFSGATARLRKVVFSLEGTATTTERRTTWDLEDTVSTHSPQLASYKLFEVERGLGVAQGTRSFTVPEEAQPRVRGAHVAWTLKVCADVQRWPDVEDAFPFRVTLKD